MAPSVGGSANATIHRTENGSDGWSDAGFERRMGRPRRGPRLRPPSAWGQDRALVRAAVKIDGQVLLKADPKFREEKDIVLIAVREDDYSDPSWEDRVYAQLPESMRRDHDVVRAALANACRLASAASTTSTPSGAGRTRPGSNATARAARRTLTAGRGRIMGFPG